jgi:hypothetical protein
MGRHGGSGAVSLPPSRAFVVQFSADTLASANRFRGRVEHIESARSRRFATLDELVTFMTSCLEEQNDGDQ